MIRSPIALALVAALGVGASLSSAPAVAQQAAPSAVSIRTGASALDGPFGVRLAVYDRRSFEISWDRIPGAVTYRVQVGGRTVQENGAVSRYVANVNLSGGFNYWLTALGRSENVIASRGFRVQPAASPQLVGTGESAGRSTPPAPANLRAEVYSSSAGEVFWDRVSGTRLEYRVSLDGGVVATTTGTSYFVGSRPGIDGTRVEVVAIAPNGAASSASSTTLGSGSSSNPTPGPGAPPAPANARLDVYSGTAAELFFDRAPLSANVVETEIRRDGTVIGTTNGTSFFDPNRTPSRRYTYELVAVNAAGARSSASTVGDTTPAPGPTDDPAAENGLPEDCLLAVAEDGTRYCYTAATRELLASRQDGQTLWRFTLPGNDTINEIRSIAFAQGRLVILAATTDDAGPAIEFSTFEPSGAFVATYVLDAGELPVGTQIDPSNAAIYGTARALYLSAALIDERSSGSPNVVVPDSILVRYDATNGALEAWRGTAGDRARELRDPAGPDATLAIVRDGAPEGIDPWLLAPVTTPLVNDDTWETHLLLARRWLEGRYLDEALDRIEVVLPADGAFNGPPVDCPEGGSVEYTGFGNRTSEFRRVYRNCRTAGAFIDGTVTATVTSQGDGGGSVQASTTVYEGFVVELDDARRTTFEIDATVSQRVARSSFQCVSISEQWTTTVERFVERSERGTLRVRSARASRSIDTDTGTTINGFADGPGFTCPTASTRTSASANASIAPPFAPEITIVVQFADAGPATSSDAELSVRADDGSSVTAVGPLDGTRADRTSWGSDGGRTELFTLRRLRPDLTALAER